MFRNGSNPTEESTKMCLRRFADLTMVGKISDEFYVCIKVLRIATDCLSEYIWHLHVVVIFLDVYVILDLSLFGL